jgi:6-phosphogluconolactonase
MRLGFVLGGLALATIGVSACGDDGSTTTTTGTGGASGSTTTTTGTGGASGSTTTTTGTGGGGATRPFVYVGTQDGTIEVRMLDRATGALASVTSVAAGTNPSFLAPSPDHRFLYAADEGQDEVAAFAIDSATGGLTELNRKSSEGGGPAYVSVDASGKWVLVANYGGGTVAVLPVLADGSLGDAVDVESPGQNPHLIRTDATNTHAYVPCLGSNLVAPFAFDATTGQLTALATASLPAGTGPRHLELHPTLPVLWVIGELGDTVTTFTRATDGTLTSAGTVTTLPNGADAASNYCADLHLEPGGAFLYGSNRGDDSLAIFSVSPGTGALTAAGHVSTGGSWPRNFGIDPEGETLLVANQQSDEVVAFRLDPSTGALTELVTTPTGAGPSWVGVVTQPE